jgi:hypothetical protein
VADWPTKEQVKTRLGITSAAFDADVQLALDAAVEQVLLDVGRDPDVDSGEVAVTASLHEAALLLAVACWKAPDAPHGVAAIFDTGGIYVARSNPHYERLIFGARETFGVA